MHCIGGSGRTGFTATLLKYLYSPYNGYSFDELVETLDKEYKDSAKHEVGLKHEGY